MITYHTTKQQYLQQAAHYGAMLPDDTRAIYEVTIKRWYKRRTTGDRSQNHHIHGHIRDIAQQTGNAFGATKHRLKALAMDDGEYPGLLVFDGYEPVSEADLNTLQAGVFIEWLHRFAAEWGVILEEEEL